jgi:hypothetical protein
VDEEGELMDAPRSSRPGVALAAPGTTTPSLRVVVEPIDGICDLTGYFDALFALAQRVEADATPTLKRAA